MMGKMCSEKVAEKRLRAEQANRFLQAIASCGRKFFAYENGVSHFDVDERGRIWFVDTYRMARIYTHYTQGRWRGFTQGGTLRELVIILRDYIKTGIPQRMHLGPYPDWMCGGDPWGYGDAMEQVRAAAEANGVRLP